MHVHISLVNSKNTKKNSLLEMLLFDAAMLIRLSKNSLCTICDT